MRQFEMCEITLNGPIMTENWSDAAPEAVFSCGEIHYQVKGFYAGNGKYKVRFLPECAGEWKYQVKGVVNAVGTVEVEPAAKDRHGIVKTQGCHFIHQDGTYYYPFGTTVYALMHQERALVEETFESLAAAPFNKVRMCVFPKHYDFNHNEPDLFAFDKKEDGSWDVNRPCFAFWDYMDEIIKRLGQLHMEADLILFHPYDRWGFSKLSHKESLTYLSYAVRRLAAYPNIWWSLANEYDFVATKNREQWYEIDEFINENDPFKHLLSNHNCFARYDFNRETVTHCSIQTKMLQRVAEWRTMYHKPVCIDECCYEGNIVHPWGSISGKEMAYRFWRAIVQGGYCTHGETFYSDDEILWWARGGKLKGESPKMIAFLRDIVESLPGPIDPVENRFSGLSNLPAAERTQLLDKVPESFRFFIDARLKMDPEEARLFDLFDCMYEGHVGDEVYLTFFDIRTCAKGAMNLPADNKYKVELVDVVNMTRQELPGVYSGNAQIDMPGKEGMALIAYKL